MEEVLHVGSYVRISCKKSAITRQFSNLRYVTTCQTSWTGSLMCISCHLNISMGLETIAAEENTDDMEKMLTASYLCQVKNKLDMLKSICGADDVLQTHPYIYGQGRDTLDLLIKLVRESKGNREHILHGCRIGKKCTKSDNYLSTGHQFAKGVYNVHSDIENIMSLSEILDFVRLLKNENNGQSSCDSDDSTIYLFSMKKNEKCKQA